MEETKNTNFLLGPVLMCLTVQNEKKLNTSDTQHQLLQGCKNNLYVRETFLTDTENILQMSFCLQMHSSDLYSLVSVVLSRLDPHLTVPSKTKLIWTRVRIWRIMSPAKETDDQDNRTGISKKPKTLTLKARKQCHGLSGLYVSQTILLHSKRVLCCGTYSRSTDMSMSGRFFSWKGSKWLQSFGIHE